MKNLIMLLACLFLVNLHVFSQSKKAKDEGFQLKTKADSVSYAIGMDIAQNLTSQNMDINGESLGQGVIDFIKKAELKLTEEQKNKIITDFQTEHAKKQQEMAAASSKKNIEIGKKFLDDNKKQEGVVETKSGLQYKMITVGTGKQPTAASKVTVHYEGKLVDGTVFDSSYQRGETISFPLSGVIPGWTEGLQLMKEGGKAMLYIPSELGYGERGAGGLIPGHATLIFTVELISVED